MADDEARSQRSARKYAHVSNIIIKQEIRARMKQVNLILKKPEEERTTEELQVLDESPDIASAVQKRSKHKQLAKDRTQEVEDPTDVLVEKCRVLAEAIKAAKNVIIYTGAGISTAASIPDYRGPNGVWTLLQKGVPIKAQDLSDAEPTITHMSITKLQQEGKVKHVVSQNCDGLHLRSGFPRQCLSEVHGNMFIEICKNCKPSREYIRLFDVTERTAVRRHQTGRMCHICGEELRDSIIHFGEKAPFTSPYNWEEAAERADEADLVLCLGSSLKVVKKYGCLWNLHKPLVKRPKLFIVNLQWTPKDDSATLKINGKCDDVMQHLMSILGYEVPAYEREKDQIFSLAVDLYPLELKTTSKKILSKKPCLDNAEVTNDEVELESDRKPAASTATCLMPELHRSSSIKTEHVEDDQLRAMLAAPLISCSSSTEASVRSTDDANTVSVRALIRSRLQTKIAGQYPPDPYTLMVGEQPEQVCNPSPERPSDKYKLIKYLLNKPADIADEKLQQLTSHLRETCESVIHNDSTVSNSHNQHSSLIYSSADSLRQLTPLSQTKDSDTIGSVKSSYPTLVGALTAFQHQEPICSIGEGQQAASVHSTGTNFQPIMGIHCQAGSSDAISKLRSLMEGKPTMEPLLIETGASAAPSKLPTDASTEGLLTTFLPASDTDAMLLAYRMEPTSHEDKASQSHSGFKRQSSSMEDSPSQLESSDVEQAENISPSRTGSVPGWFGKGLNVRKKKKRVR